MCCTDAAAAAPPPPPHSEAAERSCSGRFCVPRLERREVVVVFPTSAHGFRRSANPRRALPVVAVVLLVGCRESCALSSRPSVACDICSVIVIFCCRAARKNASKTNSSLCCRVGGPVEVREQQFRLLRLVRQQTPHVDKKGRNLIQDARLMGDNENAVLNQRRCCAVVAFTTAVIVVALQYCARRRMSTFQEFS